MGKWYTTPDLADLLNNHFAPGIQNTNLYQAWHTINAAMNMIELSASFFHGMTTSLNSAFSDLADNLVSADAASRRQIAIELHRTAGCQDRDAETGGLGVL